MFFFLCNPDSPPAPTAHHSWATGRSVLEVADGSPNDGDPVTLLSDTGQGDNAVQATSGDRPLWRPATFPGRGGIEFDTDDHLEAPITGEQRFVVVIVKPASGASRGLVSRDTSATTNHPAFTLRVTEDFG